MSIAGALIGDAIGAFGEKPVIPAFEEIDVNKTQADTAQGNLDNLALLEKLGEQTNAAQIRNQKAALQAGLPGQFSQAQDNVAALLRGEIPTDVGQQIARTSAAAGFRGGIQGSKLGGNLTARDLGLTSLGLQQTGLQNFGALAQLINPNPFNISSMFFSSQQRLGFAQQERDKRYDNALLRAQVAAAPDPGKAAIGKEIDREFNTMQQLGLSFFGAKQAEDTGTFGPSQASQVSGFGNVQGGFQNSGGAGGFGMGGSFA
tara:strand:- start:415 stop:1194 length:780 start_codon:yes stop_codon:yes gene_type:complete